MKSAVLMVVFRRPDTTRRVFDAVRRAKPPRLYIAADGPRSDRPDDVAPCAEVRAIVNNVDWPCEVVHYYRDANVGLRRNLSSAVTRFLEQEGEGIILEDDTVPSSSFFSYCDALLERHRHDQRIGVVSGYNPSVYWRFAADRYYLSETPMIWGWATWQRAWTGYEETFAAWDGSPDLFPRSIAKARGASQKWVENLDDVASGRLSTVWSYQFIFHCWANQLLSTIPGRTLVVNAGFGGEATHTKGAAPPKHIRDLVLTETDAPLRGPSSIAPSRFLDATILADYWKMGLLSETRQLALPIRDIARSVAKRSLRA